MTSDGWQAFERIAAERRSVRDLDGTPVEDDDMRAILAVAQTAPSSRNLQPYRLHWVRDPALRAEMARACGDQRAAASAGTFVVVAAGLGIATETNDAFLGELAARPHAYDDKALAYYRDFAAETRKFLRIMASPLFALLTPFHLLLAAIAPGAFTLAPLSPAGVRHWTARNAIFAAQTLLLAASARGLDACPMEGFDPRKVRKALGLPRSVVIPVVIAIGRRRDDARIDPRWRRPLAGAVVVH